MNNSRDDPFVTLLMPIRNEEAYIRRSLEAVLNQNYPQDHMEILIADGMSTDLTRQIVQEYQKKHPNFRLIDNTGRIVPTGLNRIIPLAKGNILIRVDGHCEIAPDYVCRCVEHLQRDGVDGVGGPMNTIGETPLSRTIALAMSSKFGVGGSAFRTVTGQTMLVDSVPFPAYTREIVQKAGLYDEELVRNQDDEYNYRLRGLGAKILLAADVKTTYYSRGSLKKLWKQYFQYGFWKVRVLQKHPLQMRPRQFVPLAFVAALIGSVLFSMVFSWGWVTLLAVAGTYLLANLAASGITASKNGWGHFLLLSLVYAILHLSYGLGFLVGLVKFVHRWGDKQGKVPAFERKNV